MSEDQEGSGEGLPTAAVFTLDEEYGQGIIWNNKGGIGNPNHPTRDIEEGDELVRRQDVEALIQDRLEKQEQRVDNLTGLDRVNLNDAKARREELKSLLDEVQQNP